MSYQVIARKYRPQTFADMVGQSVSVRTLQNAIQRNRVSHAYLFSGPRGTGKTTLARILAKALNCRRGTTPDPCGQCEACQEIARGSALDVIEIDAASNRGIDEIRELRDGIQYGPARDRFKIYIIDEAHMLTNEAFNALLKTLEEPPPHAVFVLATTEKQKVPVTIVSRCQPFDFQLLSTSEIAGRVRSIAEQEKLAISDKGIEMLALAGEGSLRDALSLLDQVVNYCGQEMADGEIAAILGEVDFGVLERTTLAVAQNHPGEILEIIDQTCRAGQDPQHFCRRLLQHIRNLLVCRATGGNPQLLSVPESRVSALKDLAGRFGQEELLRFLDILIRTEGDMRWAYHPRFHLELGLLKMCSLPQLQPLAQLVMELRSGSGDDAPSRSRNRTFPAAVKPSKSASSAAEPSRETADSRIAAFRRRIHEVHPLLDPWLEMAESVEFRDLQLKIRFSGKHSFHRQKLAEAENVRLLTEVARSIFGSDARVTVVSEEQRAASNPPPDVLQAAVTETLSDLDKIRQEPRIRSFLEHFPGKVTIEETEP